MALQRQDQFTTTQPLPPIFSPQALGEYVSYLVSSWQLKQRWPRVFSLHHFCTNLSWHEVRGGKGQAHTSKEQGTVQCLSTCHVSPVIVDRRTRCDALLFTSKTSNFLPSCPRQLMFANKISEPSWDAT